MLRKSRSPRSWAPPLVAAPESTLLLHPRLPNLGHRRALLGPSSPHLHHPGNPPGCMFWSCLEAAPDPCLALSPSPSPVSPDSRLSRMFSRHGGQSASLDSCPSHCLLGTESRSQPECAPPFPPHVPCHQPYAREPRTLLQPFSPDQLSQSIPLLNLSASLPLPPTHPRAQPSSSREILFKHDSTATNTSLQGAESSSLSLATQLDLRPPSPSPSALLSPSCPGHTGLPSS